MYCEWLMVFLFYLNFHSSWPIIICFFLSWHKVQKILRNLFITENWILVINILIFSTLTLIPSGHQVFALLFYAIEPLGIINDFVIV